MTSDLKFYIESFSHFDNVYSNQTSEMRSLIKEAKHKGVCVENTLDEKTKRYKTYMHVLVFRMKSTLSMVSEKGCPQANCASIKSDLISTRSVFILK